MHLVERLARDFFDEGLNNADYDSFERFIAADYEWHWGTERESSGRGRDAFRDEIRSLIDAFPDMHSEIIDVISDGTKAAVYFKSVATHQGQWGGVAPTGKRVQWCGIVIYREAGGQLAEEWSVDDSRGLFEQLGVIPEIAAPW
jgi:predicted ester cyclase